MSSIWVAGAPLTIIILEELAAQELSVRELARRSELDPRTVRDLMGGRGTSGWVRMETAERVLQAAGVIERMSELEMVVAA